MRCPTPSAVVRALRGPATSSALAAGCSGTRHRDPMRPPSRSITPATRTTTRRITSSTRTTSRRFLSPLQLRRLHSRMSSAPTFWRRSSRPSASAFTLSVIPACLVNRGDLRHEATVADVRWPPRLTGAVAEATPAFCFHLGDVIYNFGVEAEYYYDQFYEPFRAYDRPRCFVIPGPRWRGHLHKRRPAAWTRRAFRPSSPTSAPRRPRSHSGCRRSRPVRR